MKSLAWGLVAIALASVSLPGSAQADSSGQTGRTSSAETEIPSSEAMAWDRDFDLLLELSKVPTAGQLKLQARLDALEKKRRDLLAQKQDLEGRLKALQGTYSLTMLLNEMAREGLANPNEVQSDLKAKLRRTENELSDVETALKKLRDQVGG
ncbi:MAG: hypothetical protein P8Z49_01130 [Acidobacteriota bacterium]